MKEAVFIGADHAGFALKKSLSKTLRANGYQVIDCGAKKLVPTDDYPDYAEKVARKVARQGKGILICGSAEGICIAANKFRDIRAVPVWTQTNARLSRSHNDANILCLSGWQLGPERAKRIALTFLATPFSDEERHRRRIEKIRRMTP